MPRRNSLRLLAELGLPVGFRATRSGCNIPQTRSGCGNVWSSPALDLDRRALFVASSNCDTDDDPSTSSPRTAMASPVRCSRHLGGTGVEGLGVLLATVSFVAAAPGITSLSLSESPEDFAEGFALDPFGFAAVTYVGGSVEVVPEPAAGALVASGLLALGACHRTRRG